MGKDGIDAKRVSLTLSRAKKEQFYAHARQLGVKPAWLGARVLERFLDDPAKFGILSSIGPDAGVDDAQH